MSLTDLTLNRLADQLRGQFVMAEIEIDGQVVPVQLTVEANGLVSYIRLIVPAGVIGTITRRTFRDEAGNVSWQDDINIIKGEQEIVIELPITVAWKAGA